MTTDTELKKLAERCNSAIALNKKNGWDGGSEYSGAITANPETVLSLLGRLERFEAADEERKTTCLCFWCFQKFYLPRAGTPEEQADAFTAHTMQCLKNPLHRALDAEARLEPLREAAKKALPFLDDRMRVLGEQLYELPPSDSATVSAKKDILSREIGVTKRVAYEIRKALDSAGASGQEKNNE
jgi:hypothetical protein